MDGPDPGGSWAILVALREERRAVAAAAAKLPRRLRSRVRVVQGGVGPEEAARAAAALAASGRYGGLCSSGFCGGLDEGFKLGYVLLATEVREADAEDALATAAVWTERAAAALRAGGLPFVAGGICQAREPVLLPDAKRALAARTGARAVDQESCAIARACARRGLAFLALRAVSDEVSDGLPREAAGWLTPRGRVRPLKVLRFALRGAEAVGRLRALQARAARAAAALTAAWSAVLPALLAAAPPAGQG